ncbi:MAG: phosphatase [Alphaproteobacteria bacterium]|nr:MAG: phosphatase [Alphaproteobacteria bacterium]
MRPTGILFDKDGTLFDFEATYAPACARVVRALAGGDEERAARMAAAVDFDLAAERFRPHSVVIAGCAADLARAWRALMPTAPGAAFERRIDDLFELHTRDTARLFAGAMAALGRLAGGGMRIGLATNDAEANARAHLRAAGLDDLIGFVAGYDSGHGAKPEPGMIHAFARHCGCSSERVVMVGDSLRDMAAARAAGAVAVAVTTGPATAAELAPFADAVIGGLDELAALPLIGLTEATA